MICPFMSNLSNAADMDALCGCINSCALYTNQGCSLRLLAQAQVEIAKNSKNDN